MSNDVPNLKLSDEQLEILRLVENQVMSAEEAARILEALDRADQATREFPPHRFSPPPPPRAEPPPARTDGKAKSIRIRITDTSSAQARVNLVLPYRLVDSGIKLVKRLAPEQMSVLDGRDIRRSMEDGFWGPLLDITDDNQRVEIIVEGDPREGPSADPFDTREFS